MDADNRSAFYARLEDIRAEAIDKIRKGINAADNVALYAPGYFAFLSGESVMKMAALDFAERDSIDSVSQRAYRKAIRNAIETTEGISLKSITAFSSEDWSLSYFHELNDIIGKDVDVLRDESGYVGYANNFLNPDINTLRIHAAGRFLLVCHNEKIDVSSYLSRKEMSEAEIEDNLADSAEDMRILFKKKIFHELGKTSLIRFFPGSYIQFMNKDKLVAVTRFLDLFGYPDDMDRNEAEVLITNAFRYAAKNLPDPGSERISLPVFRGTDIRPENPGIYMDMLRKEAEAMEKREKSIESDEYPYITKER